MLRELRASDIEGLYPLIMANFPEEEALLGTRPEGFQRTARRIFEWDARLALGMLRLVRRPAFYFFVVEADRRVVGTTLLTFRPKAGYIAMVMVDPAYRRRGFAQKLLGAARDVSRRLGRTFTVLDVLSTNAPALALYEAAGYVRLRELSYLARELPLDDTLPNAADPPSLRKVEKTDYPAIAAMTNAALAPTVRNVLAVRPRDFHPSRIIQRELASATEGWVLDGGSGPRAYLRAVSSDFMSAGQLSVPAIGPGVTAEEFAPLAQRALRWLREQRSKRALVEVPVDQPTAVQAMTDVGFREAFRLVTEYRSTAT